MQLAQLSAESNSIMKQLFSFRDAQYDILENAISLLKMYQDCSEHILYKQVSYEYISFPAHCLCGRQKFTVKLSVTTKCLKRHISR